MSANLVGVPIQSARKYATVSTTIPTGDVATTVTLSTLDTGYTTPALTAIDTTPTNGLKALLPGLYRVEAQIEFASAAGTFRRLFVVVNGTFSDVITFPASGTSGYNYSMTTMVRLAINDIVTMQAGSAGAATSSSVGDSRRTRLTMTYLGP